MAGIVPSRLKETSAGGSCALTTETAGAKLYRARIYRNYVTSRDRPLAPADLSGLKPRIPSLKKVVRSHFPKDRDASILELGAGHGALIHVARLEGYRNIIGVDGSPEQVAEAKRLGIEGVRHANVLDALQATADGSLDAVISFDLIEHFRRQELIELVDEVRRVMRPGGRWIIHTCNAEGPFGSRSLYWDFTHELAFTRTSVAQLLLSSGFNRVRCFEDAPVPHGLKSVVRWLLWKLLRNCARLWLIVETGTLDDFILSQNFLVVAEKF